MKLDLRKLDFERPLVICRSAAWPEPLDPAFTLGYACALCAKPLQVSRTGLRQISEGRGQPLCNACGGVVMRDMTEAMKLTQQSHRPPVEIRINPEATAQIEHMTGEPILETFPHAETEILEEEEEP
jgi:hypothetical protein